MNREAIVMTIEFGGNHFNAIVLEKQLKLISATGKIISVQVDNSKILPQRPGETVKQLVNFFKH